MLVIYMALLTALKFFELGHVTKRVRYSVGLTEYIDITYYDNHSSVSAAVAHCIDEPFVRQHCDLNRANLTDRYIATGWIGLRSVVGRHFLRCWTSIISVSLTDL